MVQRRGFPVKFVSVFSILLLVGLVSASLSLSEWESTIGQELHNIFGSGTYCVPDDAGLCLDFGSILMGVFILAFFFIWSSVSGIAWDGVFFLLMIVMFILALPQSGILGIPMWSVNSFIFALIVMAVFFKMILRRG
jgi:hypothetical protein